MKKAIATLLILAGLITAWAAGHRTGTRYALTGAEVWLSENPAGEEDELIINLDLDGETWQHTARLH